MSARPVIEVDELNVRYGEFHAVRDLSFQVERRELCAVLGTNRAGKTSTLEVIEGHRTASAGTVRVFGKSPRPGARCVPGWGSCSRFAADLTVAESVRLIGRLAERQDTVVRVLDLVDLAHRALNTTTVTTLAARRQNLFLKRLRSTVAGDAPILTGLVLPVSVIATIQPTVTLVVFASVGRAPANTVLVATALASTLVMMLAFAIAIARVTPPRSTHRSPRFRSVWVWSPWPVGSRSPATRTLRR